jgi:hypothetical protein
VAAFKQLGIHLVGSALDTNGLVAAEKPVAR